MRPYLRVCRVFISNKIHHFSVITMELEPNQNEKMYILKIILQVLLN